jgi:hypothetical protein
MIEKPGNGAKGNQIDSLAAFDPQDGGFCHGFGRLVLSLQHQRQQPGHKDNEPHPDPGPGRFLSPGSARQQADGQNRKHNYPQFYDVLPHTVFPFETPPLFSSN